MSFCPNTIRVFSFILVLNCTHRIQNTKNRRNDNMSHWYDACLMVRNQNFMILCVAMKGTNAHLSSGLFRCSLHDMTPTKHIQHTYMKKVVQKMNWNPHEKHCSTKVEMELSHLIFDITKTSTLNYFHQNTNSLVGRWYRKCIFHHVVARI